MIDADSKLYDTLLNTYKTRYGEFSEEARKTISVLNRPENLTFDFGADDLPLMSPLEADKEVNLEPEETIAEGIKLNSRKRKITGAGLKIVTPNNLLTRFQVLLGQIKAGKNL